MTTAAPTGPSALELGLTVARILKNPDSVVKNAEARKIGERMKDLRELIGEAAQEAFSDDRMQDMETLRNAADEVAHQQQTVHDTILLNLVRSIASRGLNLDQEVTDDHISLNCVRETKNGRLALVIEDNAPGAYKEDESNVVSGPIYLDEAGITLETVLDPKNDLMINALVWQLTHKKFQVQQ